MNNNLLIIGAGTYGMVAKEIAESMHCFDHIAFVDDNYENIPDNRRVIGSCADLEHLVCEYHNAIVAIGNPKIRLSMLQKLKEETPVRIVSLVSPRAYVAPTAQIMRGSIIEPMAVVHTESIISKGCIISAGAVVNHGAMCCDGVHVDCNAIVTGGAVVPAGCKVESGQVYHKKGISAEDLFLKGIYDV